MLSESSLVQTVQQIPGVGKVKAPLLLQKFPSIQQLSNASTQELEEVVGRTVAQQIHTFFTQPKRQQSWHWLCCQTTNYSIWFSYLKRKKSSLSGNRLKTRRGRWVSQNHPASLSVWAATWWGLGASGDTAYFVLRWRGSHRDLPETHSQQQPAWADLHKALCPASVTERSWEGRVQHWAGRAPVPSVRATAQVFSAHVRYLCSGVSASVNKTSFLLHNPFLPSQHKKTILVFFGGCRRHI